MFPFRSPYGKQLWDMGRELVRDRLVQPSDDLLSIVLDAEIDGQRLSEVDLDNFFSILVIAGNETTRIAISQGILSFCENPGEWERLRSDPGLLNSATEEVLRYSCPTHFMRRTAYEDVTIKGVEMKKGDKVILWYVSGNRDEGGVHGARAFRHRPLTQPSPQFRARWPAHVPWRPSRSARGPRRLGGAE